MEKCALEVKAKRIEVLIPFDLSLKIFGSG